MVSTVSLRASGLYTSPNILAAPEGSLQEAKNVITRRDGVLESRRGYKNMALEDVNSTNVIKQMMEYKNHILRHKGNQIQYFNETTKTFDPINGTYEELATAPKSRYKEIGGSLFFTSNNGIQKLSLKDENSFSGSVKAYRAGVVKSNDPEVDIFYKNGSLTGIIPVDSSYSYRALWAYIDATGKLVQGAPSEKINIYNPYSFNLYQDYSRCVYNFKSLVSSNTIFNNSNFGEYYVESSSKLEDFYATLSDALTAMDDSFLFTSKDSTFKLTNHVISIIDNGGTKVIQITHSVSGQDYTTIFDRSKYVRLADFPTLPISGGTVDINGIQEIKLLESNKIQFSTTDITNVAVTTGPTTLSNSMTYKIYSGDFIKTYPDIESTSLVTGGKAVYTLLITCISDVIALYRKYFDNRYITTYYYDAFINLLNPTENNDVNIKITIPNEIKEREKNNTLTPYVDNPYFLQLYRTAVYSDISDKPQNPTPPDEMYLCYELNIADLSTDVINGGVIEFLDVTPDDRLGAALYTNAYTGEGILQKNDRPPLSHDVNTFNGYTFYPNTKSDNYLNLNLIATKHFVDGETLSITNGSVTRTYPFKREQRQSLSIEILKASVVYATDLKDQPIDLKGYYNNVRLQFLKPEDEMTNNDPNISNIPVIIKTDTITPVNLITLIAEAIKSLPSEFTNIIITDKKVVFERTNSLQLVNCFGSLFNTATFSVFWSVIGSVENQVNVSSDKSPANAIDLTAKSLVKSINADAQGLVEAVLTSGYPDDPGKIYLKSKNADEAFIVSFTGSVNSKKSFLPSLITSATSEQDINYNFLYYSKLQQPDSVPSINYIPIGNADNPIIRIYPLRGSLFIFKKEGVYRLTGDTAPFSVTLFDSSSDLVGHDSLAIVNNILFGWTSQGIAIFNEGLSKIVSSPIDNLILPLYPKYLNDFRTNCVGVGYESDNSYMVFTKDLDGNQIGFRYSTVTDSWTIFDIPATSCVLDSNKNLLVLSPDFETLVEKKQFNKYDYSDKELSLFILPSSVIDSKTLDLNSDFGSVNPKIGDLVTQVQDATNSQFNSLLDELDSVMSYTDYHLLKVTYGNNLVSNIASLITLLNINEYSSNPISTGITKYNDLIDALNLRSSHTFTKVTQTTLERRVYAIDGTKVIFEYDSQFQNGNCTFLIAIECSITYSPISFNNPLNLKHLRECTLMLQNNGIRELDLSFSTDLMPIKAPVKILTFNTINNSPVRTYIPRNAQRCRYLNLSIKHTGSNEIFALYGVTVTGEVNESTRAYR